MGSADHFDSIIIGGGHAGLSAGIYLSRAKARVMIIEEGTIGGQMVLTHEISNYPGVESVSGFQLALIMKKQAKNFGCDLKPNVSVKSLTLDSEIKKVTLSDGSEMTSDVIILTPGGRSRMLGVHGEERLKGRGISYCSTCDGDFFTGKEIVVVGGGNSALEEAVALTKYASKVTVIHQFDHFQAFEQAIEDAKNNQKIRFLMESAITAFYGDEKLESIDIKELKTGETTRFRTDGAFIFIGYIPNTGFLAGIIDLNDRGEIITGHNMSTNIPGVYAAGDCIAKTYRQVTTAVADGTIAALASLDYLNNIKVHRKKLIKV